MESDDDKAKRGDGKSPAAKRSPKASLRPYERPRGGPAKSISDLMPEIGRAAFRRFGFVQSSVVSRWGEIVGARYAAVTMPESIRFPAGEKAGGTLNLVVDGAHAVLIQHVTEEIIDRVNRFFGYNAVKRVRIRQGKVEAPAPPAPTEALRPLKPIPLELGDSLRDIGDPELLAVLESLARSLGKDDEKDRKNEDHDP